MQNMNKQETFILIWKCFKHIDKYCLLNKIMIWTLISNLFQQQIKYDFVNVMQIFTYQIKSQINKRIEKKLGTKTKVKKNDLKMAVEQFTDQMKIVSQKIDDLIKSCQ